MDIECNEGQEDNLEGSKRPSVQEGPGRDRSGGARREDRPRIARGILARYVVCRLNLSDVFETSETGSAGSASAQTTSRRAYEIFSDFFS